MAIKNPGRRGVGMNLDVFGVHNVDYLAPLRFEKIRNQASVATPPERLSAHYCCARRAGDLKQTFNPLRELLAFHVVGVCPEGSILPVGIL